MDASYSINKVCSMSITSLRWINLPFSTIYAMVNLFNLDGCWVVRSKTNWLNNSRPYVVPMVFSVNCKSEQWYSMMTAKKKIKIHSFSQLSKKALIYMRAAFMHKTCLTMQLLKLKIPNIISWSPGIRCTLINNSGGFLWKCFKLFKWTLKSDTNCSKVTSREFI